MTNEQAEQLIQTVREMKEHLAAIRDIIEMTANLTDAQRNELENKSRTRRGFAPRPRN